MAPTMTELERALGDYMSLRMAEVLCLGKGAPITTVTLRKYADDGRVRSIRDPQGRRLLLKSDVEKLAAMRSRAGR